MIKEQESKMSHKDLATKFAMWFIVNWEWYDDMSNIRIKQKNTTIGPLIGKSKRMLLTCQCLKVWNTLNTYLKKPKPGMKDLKTDPSLWNIPLTYAKKEVNELEKKVLTAKKLWA